MWHVSPTCQQQCSRVFGPANGRGTTESNNDTDEVQHTYGNGVAGARMSARRLSCVPLLRPWLPATGLCWWRAGWLRWNNLPHWLWNTGHDCWQWNQWHNCEAPAIWGPAQCHHRCLSQWHCTWFALCLSIQQVWKQLVWFLSSFWETLEQCYYVCDHENHEVFCKSGITSFFHIGFTVQNIFRLDSMTTTT